MNINKLKESEYIKFVPHINAEPWTVELDKNENPYFPYTELQSYTDIHVDILLCDYETDDDYIEKIGYADIALINSHVFEETTFMHVDCDDGHTILILNTDYAFKTQKESKYLTNEEMAGIIKTIPTMDKLYGRIIYCLIFLGLRFSEIAELSIDAIKQHDDGTYYLDISQYKTNADYEKPLYENCVTIMQREIERNKKRFGEETEIEASIQIAETNGYELMLKKALEDKENLLKVLSKLKKEDSYV